MGWRSPNASASPMAQSIFRMLVGSATCTQAASVPRPQLGQHLCRERTHKHFHWSLADLVGKERRQQRRRCQAGPPGTLPRAPGSPRLPVGDTCAADASCARAMELRVGGAIASAPRPQAQGRPHEAQQGGAQAVHTKALRSAFTVTVRVGGAIASAPRPQAQGRPHEAQQGGAQGGPHKGTAECVHSQCYRCLTRLARLHTLSSESGGGCCCVAGGWAAGHGCGGQMPGHTTTTLCPSSRPWRRRG